MKFNHIAAVILAAFAIFGFIMGYTIPAFGALVLAVLFVFRPVKENR